MSAERSERQLRPQARRHNDLVAIGRALLIDPAWPRKVQEARYDELLSFEPAALATLS